MNAPIVICGNALLAAEAECIAITHIANGNADGTNGDGSDGDSTSGDGSVGGGNQVDVPVNAPVCVGGNAVGASEAEAECIFVADGDGPDGNGGPGDGHGGDDQAGVGGGFPETGTTAMGLLPLSLVLTWLGVAARRAAAD